MIILTESKRNNCHTVNMAKDAIDLEFAARFRELLIERGWMPPAITYIELGKKLGISSACAHHYVHGARTPAMAKNKDTARRIADIFNVQVEWLLTGKGNRNIPLYPTLSQLLNKLNSQNKDFLGEMAFKLYTTQSGIVSMPGINIQEIITTVDKFIKDSDREFTPDEKLGLYFEAIENFNKSNFNPH